MSLPRSAPCLQPELRVCSQSPAHRRHQKCTSPSAAARPALQDWDLAEVALLGTLRHVSLQGAGEGVTDEAVARLAELPRLTRLCL